MFIFSCYLGLVAVLSLSCRLVVWSATIFGSDALGAMPSEPNHHRVGADASQYNAQRRVMGSRAPKTRCHARKAEE